MGKLLIGGFIVIQIIKETINFLFNFYGNVVIQGNVVLCLNYRT